MSSTVDMLSKEMESAIMSGDREKIAQLTSRIAEERDKISQDNAQAYETAKAMASATSRKEETAPQEPLEETQKENPQSVPEEGAEWKFFEKMEVYNLYLKKNKNMPMTMGCYAATATNCVLGICDAAAAISALVNQNTAKQDNLLQPPDDLALPLQYALFTAACDQLYMLYVAMRFMSKKILKDKDPLVDSLMRFITTNAKHVIRKYGERSNIEANDELFTRVRKILLIVDKMSENDTPMLKGARFVPMNRWETIKAVCDEVGCGHYEEIKEKAIEIHGWQE